MKTISLVILLFISNLLNGQITECYCFENDEGIFTEWLVFQKDQVMIFGARGRTCDNPPEMTKMFEIDETKEWRFAYIEEEDQVLFVKKIELSIDLPAGISKEDAVLRHYYSGIRSEDGLQVHIEYKPSFEDMMGPPNRFYKKIELTE